MWLSVIYFAVIGCIYASYIPQLPLDEDDSSESISSAENEQKLGMLSPQLFSKIKFSQFPPFQQLHLSPFPTMNFPPFPKMNFPPFPKMHFPPFPTMKPIVPLGVTNAVAGSAMGGRLGSSDSVMSGLGASMTSTTTVVDGKPVTKTQGVIIKNDNGKISEQHFGN